jgi:hypothetical protein
MTNTPSSDQRLANLESSISTLDARWQQQHNLLLDEIIVTNDQMGGLTRRLEQLTGRVDELTQNVSALTGVMMQFAQNAERDRAEIRQIWQYLLSQRSNGHGE